MAQHNTVSWQVLTEVWVRKHYSRYCWHTHNKDYHTLCKIYLGGSVFDFVYKWYLMSYLICRAFFTNPRALLPYFRIKLIKYKAGYSCIFNNIIGPLRHRSYALNMDLTLSGIGLISAKTVRQYDQVNIIKRIWYNTKYIHFCTVLSMVTAK